MPLTPYHLGPGLLLKALLRGGFSLMVFGWAQVLIDLQPLFALSTGRGAVHGWTHTWLGAVGIGAVAAISGKYGADLALWVIHADTRLRVAWWVAWVSAGLGTLTHVALDSLIYDDMHPWAPFSDAQPWLGAASSDAVYSFCVGSGLVGALLYAASLAWANRRANAHR